jgi:PAS domain S-box-containing protein
MTSTDSLSITTLKEGRILEINDRFTALYGYSRDEAIGRTTLELGLYLNPSDREQLLSAVRLKGVVRDLEARRRKKDGGIVTVLLSVNILRDHGEEIILNVARDITAQRRTEEALMRLHQAVESSGEVVFMTDAEGVFTFVNPEFTRLYGHQEAAVVGKATPRILKSGTFSREQYDVFWKSILAKRVVRGEIVNKTKDGWRLTIHNSVSPIQDREGRIQGFLAIQRDISERKRAENVIRESQAELAAAQHLAQMGSWRWNMESDEAFWSDEMFRIFGRPPGRLEQHGSRFLEMLHPEDRARARDALTAALQGAADYDLEYRVARPDGAERIIHAQAEVLRDEIGRPIVMRGTAHDITERKRSEQALVLALEDAELRKRELEASLRATRSVLEGTDFALIARRVFDEARAITGAQAGYIALLTPDGRENEVLFLESGGLPCTVDPNLPMPVRGLRGEVYKTGHSVVENEFTKSQWAALMPPGHVALRNVLFAPLKVDGKSVGIMGLANKPNGFTDRDLQVVEALAQLVSIALQKSRNLDAVRESEERFRTLIEKAPLAITMSRSGVIIYANQKFAEMHGFRNVGETLGRPILEQWAPSCRTEIEERTRQTGPGFPVPTSFERLAQRQDGSQFPLRCDMTTVNLVDGPASLAFLTDIAERRRAQEELQRTLDQVRALAGRLRGVREEESRRLAREIHDQLGQTLTALQIDVKSLIGELPADPQPWSKRTSSILRLVDGTMETVRRISSELRPEMLDDLGLVPAAEWAGKEFEARTGIKCRLDMPRENITIDSERATAIYRILQEILTNVARHAAASEVQVKLRSQNKNVVLMVHDNGKGMPMDKLSSKESLGILGMQERALVFGGEVIIFGAPGMGTTVRVRIPTIACEEGPP